MKNTCSILLIFLFASIILLTSTVSGKAVEQKDKTTRSDDVPTLKHERFELPDERIDRILDRLKQTNPEKAEKLSRLRIEDPQKFKTELRETIHAEFRRKIASRKLAVKPDPVLPPSGVKQSVWLDSSKGKVNNLMNRRYNEHLAWLSKNYPEEAKRLSKLKEKQPDTYREQIKHSLKKYGEIIRASKNNPQLAEVLKKDLELKEQRDKLLEKIKATNNESEKEKLSKELTKVVVCRFDLAVKKKQIRHDQLLAQLEKLQTRVKQSEAEIKKWNDTEFRNEMAKKHLEDLVSGKQISRLD